MKSRIFHTKFWTDPYIKTLAIDEKLFFIYLLSNSYVNILHFAEIPYDIIFNETGIDPKRTEEIKQKLVKAGKIQVYKDYILLSNAYKYQYYKGIKNNYLKLRIIYELNDEALIYFARYIRSVLFDIEEECRETAVKDDQILNLLKRVKFRVNDMGMYTPIPTPTNTTNKPETKNHNSEFLNQNSESLINKKERVVKREKTLDEEIEAEFSGKEDQSYKEKFMQLGASLKKTAAVFLFFFVLLLQSPAIEAKTRYVITLKETSPMKADNRDGTRQVIRSRAGSSSGSLESPKPISAFSNKKSEKIQATRAIETIISEKFGIDAPIMTAICKTESIWTPQWGWNIEAVGDSHLTYMVDGVEYGKSYGVCQIRHLPGRPSPSELLDPEINIQTAYNIYKYQGFNPWTVYKTGTYKRNL